FAILGDVVISLALDVVAVVRRMLGPVGEGYGWLSGRAAEHRYREALAAVRAVPVWSELPAGRLFEVARAMRTADVARGAGVVRQGELGDRFYLIAQGA